MKNVMMTVSQLPKPIMMISLVTCQILTLFRDIYQLIQDLPSLTESSLKGSNMEVARFLSKTSFNYSRDVNKTRNFYLRLYRYSNYEFQQQTLRTVYIRSMSKRNHVNIGNKGHNFQIRCQKWQNSSQNSNSSNPKISPLLNSQPQVS